MDFLTDNVIFLDTEFSSLNPYNGEILSIGMVKPNGEELYLELKHEGESDDWVKENILPNLKGPKVSKEKAIEKIKSFVGSKKPFMISFINSYDVVYWYKLFADRKEDPLFWIPIDFASILFALGLNPTPDHYRKLCENLGIKLDQYHQHNALDDARLLKDTYLRIMETSAEDLEKLRRKNNVIYEERGTDNR